MQSRYGGFVKRIKNPLTIITVLSIIVFSILTYALFALSLTTSVSAVSTTSTGAANVGVNLSDIIALRLLDSTATTEISELALSIDPNPNGAFTKGSILTEVSTSNPSGYSLYLTSNGTNPVGDTSANPTYTTALVNTDSSISADIGTIPTLDFTSTPSITSITERDFSVAKSLYRNRWGYSANGLNITQASGDSSDPSSYTPPVITTVTDSSTITYRPIPAHSTTEKFNEYNDSADKHLTPLTIGVNATSTAAAGVYKNIVEVSATANAIPAEYSLTFNANGTDSGNPGSSTPSGITVSTISSMPSTNPMTASSVATSYTFTIPSTAPETSVSGYEFKEWNTSADGTGTSYAPGDTVTIVTDDLDPFSTAKTIYAIWGEKVDFWGITYMQDMTTDICDALYTPSNATGSSVTMITDKATYESTVSGNNMPYVAQRTLYDYRGLDGTGSKSSPASGDNVAAYTIAKLADGNCWMTSNLKLGLSTSQAIEVVTNSTGVAKSTKWTPTGSGGTSNAATPMNGNTVCTGSGTSRKCWYSWYAATAGSGTSGQTNTDASDSICPAGWRLPSNYTKSATKSYSALTNAYFGITDNTNNVNHKSQLQSRPLNFSSDGRYLSGKLNNIGYPYYLSVTVDSEGYVYVFVYHDTQTAPQARDGKYSGDSIRCLAV